MPPMENVPPPIVTARTGLTSTSVEVYRASSFHGPDAAHVRVTSPSYIAGILVDVLALVKTGDLDLADMPDDPSAAADWIVTEASPMNSVTVTITDPVGFAHGIVAARTAGKL